MKFEISETILSECLIAMCIIYFISRIHSLIELNIIGNG